MNNKLSALITYADFSSENIALTADQISELADAMTQGEGISNQANEKQIISVTVVDKLALSDFKVVGWGSNEMATMLITDRENLE